MFVERMPSQNLEKSFGGLKDIKMTPVIPSNRSNEQLVTSNISEEQSTSDDTLSASGKSLSEVKASEWIAILILCFVNLINYMDRFTIAGVIEDIQKEFNISNDLGGLLQTAFIVSYMIFAPLFGYLGDRYSRKWIMAVGVTIWSVTTLAGSFMTTYTGFIIMRALVGIGEASYSTIAPTIISDLFVKDVRSKMLAFFYFAIPVGSGLGYIVGAETAKALGSWHWALRVTPGMGILAVILILTVLKDPERGQSEGTGHMEATSWTEDLKHLSKNKSFILSSAGFTCVAFVTGCLAWWGPKFVYMGIQLQEGMENITLADVSFKFGVITMIAGLLGVPTGSYLAQHFRPRCERIDPYICAYGLLISSPFIFLALVLVTANSTFCFLFIFLGQLALNLSWSIVADILLYVVLPTRRSTAEGVQLLVCHLLGDAGSPYLIGVISDVLARRLSASETGPASTGEPDWANFRSFQYSIFICCFVLVLGGGFFLLNALFIVKDRQKVENAVKESQANDPERRSLMS